MIVFSVQMSFLISHVPPAHSFFQKKSILENTAKSLPTNFLALTKQYRQSAYGTQKRVAVSLSTLVTLSLSCPVSVGGLIHYAMETKSNELIPPAAGLAGR